MRIVSLLPSATEIVCALGLAEKLVAVTHECDYPPEVVEGLPVVTSSVLADSPEASSREIDETVRASVAASESLYRIDHALLRDLKPDLVLTQGLCDVCAVNHGAVSEAVAALEGMPVEVLDLAPTSLEGVLETFRQVGAATGRTAEAEALVAQTRARWEAVREKAAAAPERPRTLLLEWTDPPFSAGHWNPELLALANATPGPWDEAGVPSRTITWEEIVAFAPEMLVLIPCGFDANRAIEEAEILREAPGWYDLPAVRQGECYTVDGNAYFNRPGPRLAESAEILATVLHPDTMLTMVPPYSVRRFPEDLVKRPKEEA